MYYGTEPMSYELLPLPSFRDGGLLGASDLNRIGQAQSYIKQSMNRFNIPFYYMQQDQTRHVMHRHRYLHWATSTASGADLEVNGNVVDTASGTSGYADLNAEGIGTNEVYSVVWTGAATTCKRLYEWPDTSGNTLTLPETSPTFTGGTATATQLNAISTNTQYLIDNIARRPYTPFVARRWGLAPAPREINYSFRQTHRYLYFSGELWYDGDNGSDTVEWEWKINGTPIRGFGTNGETGDGGTYYAFSWWYDLQGTGHEDFSSDQFTDPLPVTWLVANGTTLGLSPGDDYEFQMDIATASRQSRLRIELLGESPQKSVW
jgi:hypothetical protein